jgi:hypothetical protein
MYSKTVFLYSHKENQTERKDWCVRRGRMLVVQIGRTYIAWVIYSCSVVPSLVDRLWMHAWIRTSMVGDRFDLMVIDRMEGHVLDRNSSRTSACFGVVRARQLQRPQCKSKSGVHPLPLWIKAKFAVASIQAIHRGSNGWIAWHHFFG